jgi:hypothetical protein
MVKVFDHRYNLPGRNHFSKIAVPQLYSKKKAELTKEIKNAER